MPDDRGSAPDSEHRAPACAGRVCAVCCLCEACGRRVGQPHANACNCEDDSAHWYCSAECAVEFG